MEKAKNNKTVALLNGLIEINNDRIEGYEKAAEETDDVDLKSLFAELGGNSRKYRGELISQVINHGGSPAEGTTTSGKFYRIWMDIKAALTARDAKAVISSCEFGEDAALEAYNDALESEDLTPKAREIVAKHRDSIKQQHDHIKTLRDTVKVDKS